VPVICANWIVIPAIEMMMASVATDIVDGVCIPYGVYSSVAVEKTMAFLILFIGYILPLVLMIFCYSRIVYTLRTKVTKRHHCHFTFHISHLSLFDIVTALTHWRHNTPKAKVGDDC